MSNKPTWQDIHKLQRSVSSYAEARDNERLAETLFDQFCDVVFEQPMTMADGAKWLRQQGVNQVDAKIFVMSFSKWLYAKYGDDDEKRQMAEWGLTATP